MGRTRTIQSNLNGGILSPTAIARVDTKKYYNCVKDGLNTTCHPHGGQAKRLGTKYISELAGNGRLIRFSFNIDQTYMLAFTPNNIAIYDTEDDSFVQNVTTTYTLAQINLIGYAQSADTMIITHGDHPPRKLVRNSTTGVWSISDITFTNIPTYDYGSGDEAVFSATRGYPKTCTFYEARLWFGGLKSRPQTILGSVTNDFYNFDLGTSLADEAIYDTLDTDQLNPIVNIFPGRQLQVFTEGGEFSNTARPITPEDSAWVRHTNYGSKEGIRNDILDGSTFFIDRTGRNLREFIYSFTEDGYTSASASTLAYDIINNPTDTTVVRGTSRDISNLVILVNEDGSMAVFNTLRIEEVAGWTRWTTNGLFTSTESAFDKLYFIVSRDNGYFLERKLDNCYTDSSKVYTSGSATITGLDHLEGQEVQVLADGAVMDNQTVSSGTITIERSFDEAIVGLGYNAIIETLPISPNLGGGSSVHRTKKILKNTFRVHETQEMKVNDEVISFRQYGQDTYNSIPTPFSGVKEIRQLGYGRLQNIEIKSDTPTPFWLLAIETEVNTK